MKDTEKKLFIILEDIKFLPANHIIFSIHLSVKLQTGFGEQLTLSGHRLTLKGIKMKNLKNRIHTALSLRVRNIHATNHDNRSRSIVRHSDNRVTLDLQLDLVRSVNGSGFICVNIPNAL